MVAKMSGSEPEPSPATVKGIASRSSQVFTLDMSDVAQTLTSLVTLPIQVNLRESYWVLLEPISGSIAMPREHTPMNVVSAADAVADDEIDGAAAIEALDGLRLRGSSAEKGEKRKHQRSHRTIPR